MVCVVSYSHIARPVLPSSAKNTNFPQRASPSFIQQRILRGFQLYNPARNAEPGVRWKQRERNVGCLLFRMEVLVLTKFAFAKSMLLSCSICQVLPKRDFVYVSFRLLSAEAACVTYFQDW